MIKNVNSQIPTPNSQEAELLGVGSFGSWELTALGQSTVQSVSMFTSLTKMRLPESVGCAHVALSATV